MKTSPDINLMSWLSNHRSRVLLSLLLLAALLVLYGPTIRSLMPRWLNEPDYSHCIFVPLFSVFLLWRRRDQFRPDLMRGNWWGGVLIAIGALLRLLSAYEQEPLVDAFSMLPLLLGITVFLGGSQAFRWAGASVLFLVFMVPLPGVVSTMLSGPLQRIATIGGVYVAQVLGVPAVAQGNVIWLSEGNLGVAEACAGLRMLNLFVAFCVAASFLIDRPWWEKLMVIASAIPIALAANIIRIALTGFVHEYISPEFATKMFHDLAGLVMMPLTVLLVALEVYFLAKLFTDPGTSRNSLVR